MRQSLFQQWLSKSFTDLGRLTFEAKVRSSDKKFQRLILINQEPAAAFCPTSFRSASAVPVDDDGLAGDKTPINDRERLPIRDFFKVSSQQL